MFVVSLNRMLEPTRFFTVVGAAYVPERHADTDSSKASCPAARPAEIDVSASSVVLLALIAGIAIFAGEVSILASVGLTTDVMAAVIE